MRPSEAVANELATCSAQGTPGIAESAGLRNRSAGAGRDRAASAVVAVSPSEAAAIILPVAARVFISFDYDNDQDLRTLLANQAKFDDSPFEIADWSVKEAFTGNWQDKVRKRIRQVGQMAVICGYHTDGATGVAAELRIAREEEKPYFLLRGRSSGTVKKPTSALGTDKIYDWTWPNLKLLIGGAR